MQQEIMKISTPQKQSSLKICTVLWSLWCLKPCIGSQFGVQSKSQTPHQCLPSPCQSLQPHSCLSLLSPLSSLYTPDHFSERPSLTTSLSISFPHQLFSFLMLCVFFIAPTVNCKNFICLFVYFLSY